MTDFAYTSSQRKLAERILAEVRRRYGAPSGLSASVVLSTAGTLPVWTAPGALGNSLVAQSGSVVTVTGSLTATAVLTGTTRVVTPEVRAAGSAGVDLANASGTAQLRVGSGGGDNISLLVATNINPANAAVSIAPTGTGTVTLNPATAGTINNMSVGATTAASGRFTTLTSLGNTTLGDNASVDIVTINGATSITGDGFLGQIPLTTTVTAGPSARFRYDASNYLDVEVNSIGNARYRLTGATANVHEFDEAITAGDFIDASTEFRVNGVRVVTSRLTAVTKPTGGTVQDTEARAAIDAIIDRLRVTGGHGLIAD